jgi:uncharacterized membrane protein YfcA
MIVLLVATMCAVGLLLGFVGAGGSGFIISILTVGFGYPIHTALGTALSAMAFSSLSGAVSHYREGNISLGTGAAVGSFGALGAVIGSRYSAYIPSDELKWFTSGMLFLSGFALWLRMFIVSRQRAVGSSAASGRKGFGFWLPAIGIGVGTGAMSGLFGIGSTPFIQIGLLAVLGMSARQAAGTTMLVILPIAIAGGVGFLYAGHLDIPLLAEVVCGTMLGTFVGAKFTKRVPVSTLKTAMVLVPMIGGFILLL